MTFGLSRVCLTKTLLKKVLPNNLSNYKDLFEALYNNLCCRKDSHVLLKDH